MTVRRLLRRATRIATLAGHAGPRRGVQMSDVAELEQGSIVVGTDGRIEWIGCDRDLPVHFATESIEEFDCAGAAIVPAFVDSHTHAVWAGHRRDELELRIAGADYEAILAAGGGILASVAHTRAADDDQLAAASRPRLKRMRAAGTTTIEIKSGYGLDLDTELRQLRVARALGIELGMRVHTTCLVAHAVPLDARDDPFERDAWIQRICAEILPEVARHRLADSCDVFCDRGAYTIDESRRILQTARALGMRLRVHANELGHTGGALLAAELRADSADHLLHLDDTERSALRDAGVTATLLPGTSLVLHKPWADGRALITAGVAVAVATDCNPGSCAIENLGLALALACHGCRLLPSEALCAVTHNAAASLGLSSSCGRLEVGMSADLLILATDDWRDLVYHAGSALIREVLSGDR